MAFLAPLAPALKFAAIGLSAYSAIKTLTKKDPAPPAPIDRSIQARQDLQQAQQTASADAAEIVRRRRRAGTQTVFTNPLGVEDKASVAKKTILGE